MCFGVFGEKRKSGGVELEAALELREGQEGFMCCLWLIQEEEIRFVSVHRIEIRFGFFRAILWL